MWDKIKNAVNKLQGKKEVVKETTEDKRRAILAKEKEEATSKGEPWVAVLDTQLNPDNIKNGFFELDWNNQFIEELLDAGYSGEQPEHIVDQWFRTIATQMLDEEGQEPNRGMGYIETSKADNNGKAEVK